MKENNSQSPELRRHDAIKILVKYVEDRLNDGPNVVFGQPTMRDMVSAVKELAPHVLVWNEAPSLLGGDYYVRVRASEDSPWTRSFIAKYSEEYLKEITPSPLCQYAGPIAAPLE